MTTQGLNPYRGPFSYKEADEDIFFGRNSEVEELIELIRKNQLTVLYGASGTGKTSLIHAKLLPQLKRQYFHPIYIRINFANKQEDPLHFIQKRIVEELRMWDEQIPEFQPDESLIQYAAENVIYKGLIKPVLFFDQFEELFTLGPKNDPYKIHRFMFQLSELIELRLPDNLKTINYINNISSFKVVFSLRQDWIGFLDDFNQLIPSVNEVRYRLKKFSPIQALEAIICPSKDNITHETAEAIIKNIGTPALWKEDTLSTNNLDKELINKEIDPFVLSLYCYQLYDKCIQRGHFQITTAFVLEHQDTELIRNYYEEKIEKYKEIKYLIEDKLLNESGKRLVISLNKFTSGDKAIEELTYKVALETGIVRIIGVGAESEIEIVHDRLALQIFEGRNERIAKEIHEDATKKQQQAESLKQAAQQAKKTAFRIGIIAATIIVILAILMIKIYVDFLNNHDAQKLQAQLYDEKNKNKEALDSIESLNTTLRDQASNSELASAQPGNSVNKEKTSKEYDALIRQQNEKLSIFRNERDSLIAGIGEKDERIHRLESDITKARESIVSLESTISSISQPTTASSIVPTSTFKPSDLLNLKIDNSPQNPDGSYVFSDIKNHGFTFSFNVSNIPDEEKGTIRIRVDFPKNAYDNNQISFETAKTIEQPIKLTVKLNKGELRTGSGRYVVMYLKNIDDKTPLVLARGSFTISRPPTQNPTDQ